jgi:hypothetical protein
MAYLQKNARRSFCGNTLVVVAPAAVRVPFSSFTFSFLRSFLFLYSLTVRRSRLPPPPRLLSPPRQITAHFQGIWTRPLGAVAAVVLLATPAPLHSFRVLPATLPNPPALPPPRRVRRGRGHVVVVGLASEPCAGTVWGPVAAQLELERAMQAEATAYVSAPRLGRTSTTRWSTSPSPSCSSRYTSGFPRPSPISSARAPEGSLLSGEESTPFFSQLIVLQLNAPKCCGNVSRSVLQGDLVYCDL